MRRLLPLLLLSAVIPLPAAETAPWKRLPLGFEPNLGQHAPDARFTARGRQYEIRLHDRGIALQGRSGASVAVEWLSDSESADWTPLDRQRGVSHYLRGQDRSRWTTATPRFGRVRQHSVFPGVDLEHYGAEGRLEFDFVLEPGADPDEIGFAVHGADQVRIDPTGDLVLETPEGEVRSLRPVAYQPVDGRRVAVAARYVLSEGRKIRFALGDYDREQPLVIDPIVEFATYLAGDDDDGAAAVTMDDDGYIYLTGYAEFAEEAEPFPTTEGVFQAEHGGEFGNNLGGEEDDDPGMDVFVMKLMPDGSEIVFSTFYGAADRDVGKSIDVDADGAIYVAGETVSLGLPTSTDAVQSARPAGTGVSGFAAKFSADGSELLWGTYLGGAGRDTAQGIAADGAGGAVVAGMTSSNDFTVTTAAPRRGRQEAFVLQLTPDGTDLVFSTVLSGSLDEWAHDVALGADGAIYVAGFTDSTDFPTTPGAFQQDNAGGEDAFAAKLSADGATVDWLTLLGGSADDRANALALQPDGSASIAGITESSDLPVGDDAFQTDNAGGADILAATVSADGSTATCTYLGGDGDDEARDLVVNAQGDLLLTGETQSQDFPVTSGIPQPTLRSTLGDAFYTRMNATGIVESTFFGSSNKDTGRGVATGADGAVVVVGVSEYDPVPRTPIRTQGAIRARGIDGQEAFVVKFEGVAAAPPFATVSAASFAQEAAVAAESLVSGFGENLAGETAAATSVPLPMTLAGVRVLVTDSAGTERAAELIFVSAGQINYIVPTGTAAGEATVNVERDGATVAEGSLTVAPAAPSLFTANANGEGVAAAVVVQASGGMQTSFNAFSSDLPGSRTPVPINLGDEGDVTVLIIFGTGFRGASEVTARIGEVTIPVLFAGAQGEFVGLDQANVELLRELIGSGVVEIVLIADGVEANRVTIAIE